MKHFTNIIFGLACGALMSACAAGPNVAPAAAEQPLRDPFSPPFVLPPPVVATNAPATVRMPSAPIAPAAVPVAPAPASSAQLATELRQALHIQGFVQQGGRNRAMINGRLVAQGDIVQVRLGAVTQRFRVASVTATTVNFEPLP